MQAAFRTRMAEASIALLLSSTLFAQEPAVTAPPAIAAPAKAEPAAKAAADADNRFTRDGMVVEFTVKPAMRDSGKVLAADWADVQFRIKDANTGAPITGRYPAAWMDLSQVWEARGEGPLTCRDRVSTYMKGIVGLRPMIDLNSHYLMVMNRDASITVIDPAVGISGLTNMFAQINLERPAADWAKSADQKRMFVTMPKAGKVAVVDTEVFKVTGSIDAGDEPTRTLLQADQRYLWVGNNGSAEKSGVTAIDTSSLKPVAFIATGKGHHELALSDDDRYLFVTNRDEGSVSVVNVRSLKKVLDLKTGPMPISVAFSTRSKAFYVADAKSGSVAVVDPSTLKFRARVELKPGLGPLRFSPDGRWGLVVNPSDDTVRVIDASTDKLVHTITVGDKPYQVTFTRQYAYVRSLGTERVSLITLSSLAGQHIPPLQSFAAGEVAPGTARELGIANSMVPAVKEAAAFVANPAQGTVYYYMEGMVSPAGGFRNYGHDPRGVEIADRSLQEKEPGLYSGRAKMPVAGTYDVAFILDQPRMLHCFSTIVEPNPAVIETAGPMSIEYKIAQRNVPVGKTVPVRFRLGDPRTGTALADLKDVQVMYYNSAGGGRTVVPATVLGGGEYEATVTVSEPMTYYVFVASASQKVTFTDIPYATLIGLDEATAKAFAARDAAAKDAAARRAPKPPVKAE